MDVNKWSIALFYTGACWQNMAEQGHREYHALDITVSGERWQVLRLEL
jgi:hypothetical protein